MGGYGAGLSTDARSGVDDLITAWSRESMQREEVRLRKQLALYPYALGARGVYAAYEGEGPCVRAASRTVLFGIQ